MAAGLGFKDFTTGEVLTAADVDGYLMQGVWVFASAAARDAAVTSPQEGNFAYLKDTNTTTYYTGSAWTNLDTTGMVNPMTTTGDTIYSSSGSTPARLGIGTAGQVLTVNAGATAPEWKTASGGGKLLQVVQGTYSTQQSSTSTSYVDTNLTASITPSATTSKVLVMISHQGVAVNGASSGVSLKLFRGATELAKLAEYAAVTSGTESNVGTVGIQYLDSPSTTSSTTYKTQFARSAASGTAYLQSNGGGANITSTITLMEIGA